MGSVLRVSNQRKWGGAVLVGLLLLLFIAVGAWFAGDRSEPPPSIEFTPVQETPTTESAEFATPHSTPVTGPSTPPVIPDATPGATQVGSPGATPESPATRGVPDRACRKRCLVRVENVQAVTQILDETGERPSYSSDRWLWSVVERKTVDALEATDTSIYLVKDSPETLYLFATRLPDGKLEHPAVNEFGEILDTIEGHSIVLVESVPPTVGSIVDAGIWIEKVRPAAPEKLEIEQAGRGDPIADIDVGVLMPEVSPQGMLETIGELQGMSSTDGTGIGTRQYSQTGNVMAAEYLFTRLEMYGLEVWYEDFITWEGYLVSNVVGEIPGRDESMVYGVMAHLDSTAESFAEAPGADDNASGVAGGLEIARILAGYELEHSVHIIFVNAEETSIIGSMAYADGIIKNDVPIEGIFNLDTLGNPVYGPRLILNSGPKSAWMTDLLIRMNDGYGLGQDIRAYQSDKIVADDNMLRSQGIEAVLVARLLADDYTVHHTSQDTMDNMSIDYAVSATQLVLITIGVLVQ